MGEGKARRKSQSRAAVQNKTYELTSTIIVLN